MSDISGWEMVGWGTPTPQVDAAHMFAGDDPGWHNMEKGADGPTDADISENDSGFAVYRDAEGNYHTISLWVFDNLDELERYVDYTLSEEYV